VKGIRGKDEIDEISGILFTSTKINEFSSMKIFVGFIIGEKTVNHLLAYTQSHSLIRHLLTLPYGSGILLSDTKVSRGPKAYPQINHKVTTRVRRIMHQNFANYAQ